MNNGRPTDREVRKGGQMKVKLPKAVSTWGIMWRSVSKLDGVTEHIVCHDCLPRLFRTRNEARKHIDEHFGYIRNRPDLRCEPHGWKIPVAIRVTTAVDGYHLHPGNEVARALNIIRGEGLLTCPKCGKIDEPAQVCQYCRHQWYTTSRLDRGCEKDIKL